MRHLLDTNVVSELRRGQKATPSVRSWVEDNLETGLFLSVITIGELRRGIALLESRDRVASGTLDDWLATVLDGFGGRVLPIDADIADRWGRLDASRPLSTADGLIAATALINRMTVATRDPNLLAHPEVPTVNPFKTT